MEKLCLDDHIALTSLNVCGLGYVLIIACSLLSVRFSLQVNCEQGQRMATYKMFFHTLSSIPVLLLLLLLFTQAESLEKV